MNPDNAMITRETIKQKLIETIANEIDEKVYKWMETKQTKFNCNEQYKIKQFSIELIKFLNSLRNTRKMPTTFREQIETFYIGNKITFLMKTYLSSE